MTQQSRASLYTQNLSSFFDLADEATTRRNYEWFRQQPNSPRLTFEEYALAYGEKKAPSDDEVRAIYERYCRDLKAAFPGAITPPTFEEFQRATAGEAL